MQVHFVQIKLGQLLALFALLLASGLSSAGFLEKAAGAVGAAVGATVQVVTQPAQQAASAAQGAAIAVQQAAQPVITEAQKGVQIVTTEVGKGAQGVTVEVGKDAQRVVTEVDNGAQHVATEVGKGAQAVTTETGKGLQNIATETSKAVEAVIAVKEAAPGQIMNILRNVSQAQEKALKDIARETQKGLHDTEAETGRVVRKLDDADKAGIRYLQREAQGAGNSLTNAEKRLREGKVVDAFWHLSTEHFQNTEQNAALATEESEYVNTIAGVAASAYGGPAGAAAYASWHTYKLTGDADLALRVGLLTGATSAAMKGASGMESKTAEQVAKKAIVAGAVGGLAVAAAGGDEEAIRQGFLLAGGTVLVQDGYQRVTGSQLDARSSEGDAYCMATVDADCSPPQEAFVRDANGKVITDSDGNPKVDMSKVPPRSPHVGTMAKAGEAKWQQETSPFMTSVSRIPGMNAMALAHDQWAISWDMNGLTTSATIAPAIVLTYIGTGEPYYQHLSETAVASRNAKGDQIVGASDPRDTATLQRVYAQQMTATAAQYVVDAGKCNLMQRPDRDVCTARAEQTKTIRVADLRVAEELMTTGLQTHSLIASYSCGKGGGAIDVISDKPDGTKPYCRVLRIDDSAVTTIAGNRTLSQCVDIAGAAAKQLLSSGYSCFVRKTIKVAVVPEQTGRTVFAMPLLPLLALAFLAVGGLLLLFYKIGRTHGTRKGRLAM